jgi:predicted DNA-binding transcriptional regulator YafY
MHAGRPYVVAFCRDAQDFRSFALQRITAATVLDEPFERRADFDAKAFTERGFGVHHGDVHSFVICFGPAVTYLAHERRWHRTQELETLNDNSVLLRFTASGLPEVAAWVASFGGAVRAVEPNELIEAVRRLHAEGLRAQSSASHDQTNPANSSRRRKKSPSKEPLTSIVNDRWHGESTGE